MLTQSHARGKAWTDTWARLEDERIMLQRIAAGYTLMEVLAYVLRTVEAQSSVPLWTSILLLEDNGTLHVGAAPRLPEAYLAAIEGAQIKAHDAGWGHVVYSGEPVYIDDIATHPDWAQWYEHLRPLGLQACWSTPIKHPSGRVLGIFSNYYRDHRQPSEHDVEAIALVTRTAGLAIERHRTERALQESTRRWRGMFEGMQEGFFMADAVRDTNGECRDFRLQEANPAFDLQCGRVRGSSAGHTLSEILGGALTQWLEVCCRVLESGEPAQIEYCVDTPAQAWYEVHVLRDGTDRVLAMQLDVTARKQVEKQLLEAQRRKDFQLTLGDELRRLDLPEAIEQTV